MLSDAELGGGGFPQDLLDAIDTYAAYTADPEMELKAAIARADVVHRLRKIIAQAKLANQLQEQLAKARSDALEEAAKICETTIEILYSMYGDGLEVESSARECAHAIREAKGKP